MANMDVNVRIDKASQAFGRFKKVFQDKILSITTKRVVYRAVPDTGHTINGSETWTTK